MLPNGVIGNREILNDGIMTVSSLSTMVAVSNLALLVQIWKVLTRYSINKSKSIVKDLKGRK